ncbi:MAG: FAD-dependent oxidoreductase [Spirochaetales bacterium]|nr:FAD-dependent oxidoreductase [Spirochaetales bacterium]
MSKIQSFGSGVYELELTVPVRSTKFQPGQFLHLTLDDFDPTSGWWPESRVFSIASEPKQTFVTIVYSVKGNYTKRMEDELVVGKKIWIKLPYGDFVIQEKDTPLVLVAGGTGVSPYWPFLLKPRETGAVHLFYGVREENHILFFDKIQILKSQKWFHLHLMVENGSVKDLPYKAGRLSVSEIKNELGEKFDLADFYLSGPPVMIKTFKNDLTSLGIMDSKVHIDEWE